MSGRLLSFKDYIGGADNVFVVEMFPSDQKKYTYAFGDDVSSYTFTADYQSLLLDSVTYDRVTGDPNFTDTNVTGYFTNTANVSGSYIDTSGAVGGAITLTIPENRYTGNIIPNARTNVVATVLSFQWATNETPPEKSRHRYCILERFDPQVGKVPGDPSSESNFVSL
jgi:hypothetical protein